MFGDRLKMLRNKAGFSQKELAGFFHVTQQTVAKWENNKATPPLEVINQLCQTFGVTTDFLLGNDSTQSKGIKIPVLGRVQAGIPVEAVEDIIDYEEIPQEMARNGEYFALEVRGDSMLPKFTEGDVVIVRKQSDVESGDIAIVRVNGDDATMKKLVKHSNGISLVPLNPSFEPMFYTNEEVHSLPIDVAGRVVELRAKF